MSQAPTPIAGFDAQQPSDGALAAIYRRANGEDIGKAQPLTTQRIFKAMRAMLPASTPTTEREQPSEVPDIFRQWNKVRSEARALSPSGLGPLLAAVDAYGDARAAQSNARGKALSERRMNDMAHDAYCEAAEFGVSEGVFQKLARSVKAAADDHAEVWNKGAEIGAFEAATNQLIASDPEKALGILACTFINLTLAMSRGNCDAPAGDITIQIDGGLNRDITIHAPKKASTT